MIKNSTDGIDIAGVEMSVGVEVFYESNATREPYKFENLLVRGNTMLITGQSTVVTEPYVGKKRSGSCSPGRREQFPVKRVVLSHDL
jgi:hypothetical protein